MRWLWGYNRLISNKRESSVIVADIFSFFGYMFGHNFCFAVKNFEHRGTCHGIQLPSGKQQGCRGGQGGQKLGRKGAGGAREAGEEGAESGILKVAGSGRKGGNYVTLRNISQSKEEQRGGSQQK